MHWIDYFIIFGYLGVLIGIGIFFLKKQSTVDEYFVGDRKMGSGHISFSVVATDVGGGFSIGLGGVGFLMGLSGSWLLFTGLVGAWLSAVILIPKVKFLGDKYNLLSYPDFLERRYDRRTRLLSSVVSGLGYATFVGAQILAGAKLASAAFNIDLTTAVLIMSVVVIIYTAFGGLQAVIYTDSLQWFVLLSGLLLLALPLGYREVGGLAGMRNALPPEFFTLTNISWEKFFTWMFTIVPIWFVGMTLYQRMYATKDVKTARRAWYIAGLLEYPLMSFLGVGLGMFGRIMFPEVESEMGLPLLIKNVLPIGAVGVVLAAYFSAIMSTADSCLLASVGNFVNDLYQKYINPDASEKKVLLISRLLTVGIGIISVAVALGIPKVLDSMLLAYKFMVSGLFIPTLAGILFKRVSAAAALLSIIIGGVTSIILELDMFSMLNPWDDSILVALPLSLIAIIIGTLIWPSDGTDKFVEDIEELNKKNL